jgi:large conductance mechanosensitive channel
MSGFKAFILRGNLVELAVAFIMGAAFATLVTAFTDMLLAFVSKAAGSTEVGTILVGGVDIAPFVNALIAFLLLAVVVYFGVVLPYTKAKERFFPTKGEPEGTPEDIVLLSEIRDALVSRGASPSS